MVNKILQATGIPYRETRFLKPPNTSYAIYNDALERRGGDSINLINNHNISIELYQYTPDPESEKAIEDQFDILGIAYTKDPRYWIQEEQLYQVIYNFSYFEKGGLNNV
jgi:hypothetical protein